MACSPEFKVYNADKQYIGCVKHAEDAAILVSARGGTVRWLHKYIVWREGEESQSAGHSYDYAANVMLERIREINQRAHDRVHKSRA